MPEHRVDTCIVCGKVYTQEHYAERYCSNECRYNAKLKRNRRYSVMPMPQKRACEWCKEEFLAKHARHRFCVKCSLKNSMLNYRRHQAYQHRRQYGFGIIDDDEV